MKKLFLILLILNPLHSFSNDKINLLIVGDSQVGATWSKTYFGNFLQECLADNFLILGKGSSTLTHWLGKGGLDNIEIIQRDPEHKALNLGRGEDVPLSKKRIGPMIDTFGPDKILFSFGGNYTASSDDQIRKEITSLIELLTEKKVLLENCLFFTPTYEMEVSTNRNVPLRDLKNIKRITNIIETEISGHCQIIKGIEIMKSSPYFDPIRNLLIREPFPQSGDCSGAASNDNAHVCGKAAQDMALRVCDLLI